MKNKNMIIIPELRELDNFGMDLSDYPNTILVTENMRPPYIPLQNLYESWLNNTSVQFLDLQSDYIMPSGIECKKWTLDYISSKNNGKYYYYHNYDLLNGKKEPFLTYSYNIHQYLLSFCREYEIIYSPTKSFLYNRLLIKGNGLLVDMWIPADIDTIVYAFTECRNILLCTTKYPLDLSQLENNKQISDKWLLDLNKQKVVYLGKHYLGLNELSICNPELYRYLLNQTKKDYNSQSHYQTSKFNLYIRPIYIYQDMQIVSLYLSNIRLFLSNENKGENNNRLVAIPCSMALHRKHNINSIETQEMIFQKISEYWNLL